MVKELTKNNHQYFQCEACGFYYESRELAEKCEKFCNENKSCSMEITKHAVQI